MGEALVERHHDHASRGRGLGGSGVTARRRPPRKPSATRGPRNVRLGARRRGPRCPAPATPRGRRLPTAPDPVEILEEQAATRVPELVPIRYGRMLVLAVRLLPRRRRHHGLGPGRARRGPGIRVQACGDAHVSNFGLFASPERELLFDINDFDETLPGPWEWDVKRLAASLAIAGPQQRLHGQGARARSSCGRRAATGPRCASSPGMRNLDVWYAHLRRPGGSPRVAGQLDRRSLQGALEKRRGEGADQGQPAGLRQAHARRRRRAPDRQRPAADRARRGAALREVEAASCDDAAPPADPALPANPARRPPASCWRTSGSPHLARKVVGVGSVGTRAWIILLLGRDDEDPLFLQAKEAQASVLEPFVGKSQLRATTGSGWSRGSGSCRPPATSSWAGSASPGIDGVDARLLPAPVARLEGLVGPRGHGPARSWRVYGELCGWTLASAHARSGDRIAIASYLGGSDVVRPGDRVVRRGLRRPEREGPRGAHTGDRDREGPGHPGDLRVRAGQGYSRASMACASRSRSMKGSPLTSTATRLIVPPVNRKGASPG